MIRGLSKHIERPTIRDADKRRYSAEIDHLKRRLEELTDQRRAMKERFAQQHANLVQPG